MKTIISVAVLAASCVAQSASAAGVPKLNSTHAVVFDATNQEFLLDKDGKTAAPIASITKVLTAMVALDAKPDMRETLQVSGLDVDLVKHSTSRVAVGTELSRTDALHLALMSSENRAASALSRNYPGGSLAFVRAMNEKARKIGMTRTSVEDPTGLSPQNQASAQDLVRMVLAAERYAPIARFTTSSEHTLPIGHRTLSYHNSNPLVGKPNWDIELSKTGYTQEAGRCIVMKMAAAGKQLVVVLLGSPSSSARMADIQAIKRWVSGGESHLAAAPSRFVRTTDIAHAAVRPTARSRLQSRRLAAVSPKVVKAGKAAIAPKALKTARLVAKQKTKALQSRTLAKTARKAPVKK
jgi:D-alanyl-D-alanine endopeptidase (penicillin-binding protein 7)